jgi:AcrR family transcriptional regulator
MQLLSSRGVGAVTIEAVCAAAGYTRGAFHSNFLSIEDLLFAVYKRCSGASLARLKLIIDGIGQEDSAPLDLNLLVARVLDLLPTDNVIHVLSAVFTSYGNTRPELAREVLEFRHAARAEIEPALVGLIQLAGRTLTVDAPVFTRAIMAGYLGGVSDTLLEDPSGATSALVVTTLVTGLTTVTPSA